MDMEPEEALSFISFALEQRDDELLFQRWIIGPQFEISFDEFRQGLKPKPIKSDAEILADVKTILDGFGERRNSFGDI